MRNPLCHLFSAFLVATTHLIAVLFLSLLLPLHVATAQAPGSPGGINPSFLSGSLFQDVNGDGALSIVAFGDSITRGTGDFIGARQSISSVPDVPSNREAGYPLRIEALAQVGVNNAGRPGERATRGLFRFAQAVPSFRPDLVILTSGSNDAGDKIPASRVFRTMQTQINIARALRSQVVLATIPPACCGHASLTPFTDAYNREFQALSHINGISLAPVQQAFLSTCGSRNQCYLLNLPEGLHPNIEGYDVMGETILATLLGINILAPEGPATLATALNLPPEAVRTKPLPVPAP